MKIIAQNRKAHFDYTVFSTLEAGIVLKGDEVKSIKAGHISLIGAFALARNNEVFLLNCRVSPYEKAFSPNEDIATRTRKLLLKRKEINKIIGDISRKGITLIPLKVYLKDGLVKIEIGMAKHKKAAGKKEALKERDIKRETSRTLKDVYKYR